MGEWEPNWTRASNGDERGQSFPADFSDEEIAFATELRALFPVEQEELPPHYISTLVGCDLHTPLDAGYEHKISYHVFQQLDLPRAPLFGEGSLPWWRRSRLTFPQITWPAVADALAQTSRPLMGAMGAAVLIMLMMVMVATPSFAAGLLLIFGHTGVTQVQSYPKNISHSKANAPLTGPQASAQANAMPLYWLGSTEGNYTYSGMLNLQQQEWSEGPIADIQYALNNASDGSGFVDIREFQISDRYSNILQVVASGYASETQLADGTFAVYVDGEWIANRLVHSWQSGEVSRLIFERDGVIFWITGDQRDGIDQNALTDIANHLMAASAPLPAVGNLTVRSIAHQFAWSFGNLYSGELYYEVPLGVSSTSGIGSYVLMQAQSRPSMY
jgi:hypothetical protein